MNLITPALFGTHLVVFFAVHETRRIFLSPFVFQLLISGSIFETGNRHFEFDVQILYSEYIKK